MRRYEGFLRGTPARPCWPSRIWIVAVQLIRESTYASEETRRSSLDSWAGIVLNMDGPRMSGRIDAEGRTARQFWDWFIAQDRPRGKMYVVSPRALMAWQTLGLWDRVESGNIVVSPLNTVDRTPNVGRGVARSPGLLLTNDPPTAGVFEHVESELQFTWTCAGNYGLQPISAGIDARGESSRLAECVLQSLRILSSHQLGGWGITAGGIAKSGWIGSYGGPPLYVSNGTRGDPLEARAVAGGLLLARPTGDEPVTAYSVDCRSMYPWICCHYPQATDLTRRVTDSISASKLVHENALTTLADVDVETQSQRYPQWTGTATVYPTGTFRTVLCGPELKECIKRGELRHVHSCNVYRLGFPMGDYQRRCWSARQECEDGPARLAAPLVKRLGVSLVGKMAQRTEVWQETTPDITDPLWGSWTHFTQDGRRIPMRARAGITEACIGSELCAHSILPIPLWVWSWGRVKLWRWIDVAGPTSVLYADTDGLLLTTEGYERLKPLISSSGSLWGQLRYVTGPTPCSVKGAKEYTLGERVVQAGRPLNQRQSREQIGDAAWYRLPWNELHDPGWGGSWVERMR